MSIFDTRFLLISVHFNGINDSLFNYSRIIRGF